MPFEKGQSGNPGGRPKENAAIKALAREHGPKAIEKLAGLLDDTDPRVVVSAAQALLDRGFGKPTQPLAGDDDHDAIRSVTKVVREIVRPRTQSTDG